MKKIVVALSAILAVSACTRMDQYMEGKVVVVDGAEYLVRQLPTGSYQAMPNSPKMTLHVDAAVWGKNAKAIEVATGCPIILTTVKNDDWHTIAAVQC